MERGGLEIFLKAKSKVYMKKAEDQLDMKSYEDGQMEGRMTTIEGILEEINSIDEKSIQLQVQKMQDALEESNVYKSRVEELH